MYRALAEGDPAATAAMQRLQEQGEACHKKERSKKKDADSTPSQSKKKAKGPLDFIEITERIVSFLNFEDLKNVRLISRFWFKVTIKAWNRKSQVVLRNIIGIRKLTTIIGNTQFVLPLTSFNWNFQGETIFKLMNTEGHCERELLERFWPTIQTLKFANWIRKRWRYDRFIPDPVREPHREVLRRVAFDDVTKKGSAYHVIQVLKLCTNMTTLIIHYPLLGRIKGAYIGPRQFPQLEKLRRLEIYHEGSEFNPTLESANFIELMQANITSAGVGIELPRPRRTDKTGGESLMLRLLDHTPNLTYFSVTTGRLITRVIENWAAELLVKENSLPIMPSLTHLLFSIPLTETIAAGLMLKPWQLTSLHLRTFFGTENRVTAKTIHDLILHFSENLQHLEIVFLMRGDDRSSEFPSSHSLYQLKSLELWGYSGDYSFIKDLRKLRKAVIGATEMDGSFEEARKYFEDNPMPNVDVRLCSQTDFFQRLNQGPNLPRTVY